MRNVAFLAMTASGALLVSMAACGDDETAPPTATNTTASSSSSSGEGGSGATGAGPSTGGGGSTGDGGQGGTGGTIPFHTCVQDTTGCNDGNADDLTGMAEVHIGGTSTQSGWQVPHDCCIKVDVGTTVIWHGNFTSHPLRGGTGLPVDDTSPITTAGEAVTGLGEVSVTFDTADNYPYFCTAHASTMVGEVRVP